MSVIMNIPVEEVEPNPEQPREEFDFADIESLAESIREQGQIQPITMVERQGGYTLIDGERRLRATKLLGRALIRAEVREYDEPEVDKFTQALTANLQRADLNPVEEGKAFEKLRKRGMTLNHIGRVAGKSAQHVILRLKLLEFEEEIQELYAQRRLPIDQNSIFQLQKVPEGLRSVLAKRFAANGTTAAIINRSLKRVLARQDMADVPLRGRKRAPAVVLSGGEGERKSPILAYLESNGALPQWEMVEQAARETCEHCDLFEMASAQMCRDCPAVELLKRLMVIAESGAEEKK